MVKKLTIIILSILTISSCSNKLNRDLGCPDTRLQGSINLNEAHEESYPKIYNGHLYYSSTYMDSKGFFEIVKTDLSEGNYNSAIPAKELNFESLVLASTPDFYFNPSTGLTEIYFSATELYARKPNYDLYYTYGLDGNFENPVLINTDMNSDKSEFDPHISPDGNFLYYVSNNEKGLGGFDIYRSRRLSNGEWGSPQNLGPNINTSGNERSPVVSEDGELYFSSDSYSDEFTYDIIKTIQNGSSLEVDYILGYPFNTKFNEQNFDLHGDKIYLSSDREGGCGYQDLYKFSRCGKGKLIVNIESLSPEFDPVGKLIISNELYYNEIQMDSKPQELMLAPGKYNFEFTSRCVSNNKIMEVIEIPCDEQNDYVTRINISIPEPQDSEFTFEEYNVPFFVSGYYMPNTTENLEDLKMKFAYNLMDGDSLRYIEDPEDKYDEFAEDVDQALSESLEFLNTKVNNLVSECSNSNEVVKVKIVGFSDPRAIDRRAKYTGPDIDDKVFDYKITNGTKIDNRILSKLRAYFTAKYFETELKKNPNYGKVSYRFVWSIEGRGVDPRKDLTYDYNRRVKIAVESVLD